MRGPADSLSDIEAVRSARGFIVVAVLWILAALSALVLIYLTYVTNTAVIVAGSTDRIQTEAMVTGGVELAALQLGGRQRRRASHQRDLQRAARRGPGVRDLPFRSRPRRSQRRARKACSSGLMTGLGVGASNAAAYADRILAWRAPTELGDGDPENSFYKTSGVSYLPRHAPFPAAEELWLVHGIPSVVIGRMLPFVTVFSNHGGDQCARRRAAGAGGLAGHDAGKPAIAARPAQRSRGRPACADRIVGRRGRYACRLQGLPGHGRRGAAGRAAQRRPRS